MRTAKLIRRGKASSSVPTRVTLLALALLGAPAVLAHTDPSDSTASGIGISITVFRADGVTPVIVGGVGTVTPCEKIFYQASLIKQPFPDAAFEGGTWTLETPDGVLHGLGPVPCIGGTRDDPLRPGGRGACAGSPLEIQSPLVPYTVRPEDASLFAITSITGAFAHLGEGDRGGGFAQFGIEVFRDPPCDDGLFCNGLETCDPNLVFDGDIRMGACVPGEAPCPDALFCSDVVCDEANDRCNTIDRSAEICPDDLFCSDLKCNEDLDRCVRTDVSAIVCPDPWFCADILCDEEEDDCDKVEMHDEVCPDDPRTPCVDNTCDDSTDSCVNMPMDPPPPECVLTCRTPGFWGTHADADRNKPCSQDITAAAIALGGGRLTICGECITNAPDGSTLPVNDAASAQEALCVRVQGESKRQLARHLTAAALNCIASGAGADCFGLDFGAIFRDCNAACDGNPRTPTTRTLARCIREVDCFNNGYAGLTSDGQCRGITGCHDRPLPLGVLFPAGTACTQRGGPVQGPAGSDDECSAASGTRCTVVPPGEGYCEIRGVPQDSCP